MKLKKILIFSPKKILIDLFLNAFSQYFDIYQEKDGFQRAMLVARTLVDMDPKDRDILRLENEKHEFKNQVLDFVIDFKQRAVSVIL
jgi:hypothetical protein